MLYGRGRKVLTLWGGRECSSSDSGVRANKPGDTSLSSWPVLVLLALDKKRELQTHRRRGKKTREKKKGKGNMLRVVRSWFAPKTESGVNVSEKGGGETEGPR